MGANFDDVCVRCMADPCELHPPPLFLLVSASLSLSPLSVSFSLFASLSPLPLSLSLSLSLLLSKVQDNDTVFLGCESEPRNGNHSNSSCPAQPAHCCRSLSALHCASRASRIIWGVCVCVCGGGWGTGRCHYFPSSASHLISVSVVPGSVNAAVITLISQLLFVQQFRDLTR